MVTAGATANTTEGNSRASRESGCCVHIHTGNRSTQTTQAEETSARRETVAHLGNRVVVLTFTGLALTRDILLNSGQAHAGRRRRAAEQGGQEGRRQAARQASQGARGAHRLHMYISLCVCVYTYIYIYIYR